MATRDNGESGPLLLLGFPAINVYRQAGSVGGLNEIVFFLSSFSSSSFSSYRYVSTQNSLGEKLFKTVALPKSPRGLHKRYVWN